MTWCFRCKVCCPCPLFILLPSHLNILKSVNHLREGHAPALGLVKELRANIVFLIPLESALIAYLSLFSYIIALGAPLQPSWPSTAMNKFFFLLPRWSPPSFKYHLYHLYSVAHHVPFCAAQFTKRLEIIQWDLPSTLLLSCPPFSSMSASTGACLRCFLGKFKKLDSSSYGIVCLQYCLQSCCLAADFEAGGFCNHSAIQYFHFWKYLELGLFISLRQWVPQWRWLFKSRTEELHDRFYLCCLVFRGNLSSDELKTKTFFSMNY